MFVTVPNPITDAGNIRIQNSIDRALNQPGRRIKKVVFDFNPLDENKKGSEAATTNYGSCLELARYINKLNNNGTYTIAFVHAKTTRHTVLPVLACKDLVMSSEGKIGEVAGPNDVIPEADAREYVRIVNSKFKEAVVLKMLDKNIEVVSGKEGGSQIYVDSANVQKAGTPFVDVIITDKNAKPVLPRGSVGLYNLEQAMQFKLCEQALETRHAIADAYSLSPEEFARQQNGHRNDQGGEDRTGRRPR